MNEEKVVKPVDGGSASATSKVSRVSRTPKSKLIGSMTPKGKTKKSFA